MRLSSAVICRFDFLGGDKEMNIRGFVFATILTMAASSIVAAAVAETLLERGDYLVNGVVACGKCHTPQTPTGPVTGMEMAGQFLVE